ncbi:MAG TPA: serine hydrolase domain-containing protein, partial [Burkholderiaceae bacterium]
MRAAKQMGMAALSAAVLAWPAAVRADAIDDYVQAQMALNHIPGLAVAVVRDGKIEKLRGYGYANLEWQQPVTPDSAFQLASSTKPLTGLLLMRLAGLGKLDLDAPVKRYLPDAPASWDDVTVRHLADHTSGIPDNVAIDGNASVAQYVAAAAKLPLAHAPGAKGQYGIAGYIVLRAIIEQAAGKSYMDALNEHVIAPLNLRATAFDFATSGDMRTARVIPQRASVYQWTGDSYQNFSFHYGQRAYPAGGIYSSATDLARLGLALDTDAYLSKAARDSMWKARTLANGEANGFGLG